MTAYVDEGKSANAHVLSVRPQGTPGPRELRR